MRTECLEELLTGKDKNTYKSRAFTDVKEDYIKHKKLLLPSIIMRTI